MTLPPTPRRIDSHVHVWNPATRDYPWMPEALSRPFLPTDLEPLLAAARIDAAVLVQTVSDIEETRDFLQIAADYPFIAGVVGWVDLTDVHTAHTLQELRAGPHGRYLVGIRHQVHDEAEPDWLLGNALQRNFEAMAREGLVYDLLVRTRELPSAIVVVRDFPHLRFVIDHIAKPSIASGDHADWAALMHEFAGFEHVACKLSGMVTEAGPDWTVEDLLPYVATVVEVFGPDRLMFGSDWPVCTLVTGYERVVEVAREALERLGVLDEGMEQAIFGGTAVHWYGLDREHEEPSSNG